MINMAMVYIWLIYGSIPSGDFTVCHGSHGPNRNRWFTELKNGDFFHNELLNNQMVSWLTDRWLIDGR